MAKKEPYVERLSHSRVDALAKCGIMYDYRYNKRITVGDVPILIRGAAVDAGVNVNLHSIIETGKPAPEQDIIAMVNSVIDARFHGDILLNSDEKQIGLDNVLMHTRMVATDLAILHAQKVAPTFTPLHVQRKINLKTDRFSKELTGVIDVIDKEGRVRDTKSAEKSPAKGDADNSEQLTWYALFYRAEFGELPKSLILDCLVRTPTGKTKYVPLETKRSEDDLEILLRRIGVSDAVIRGGLYLPARAGSWWCSADRCAYHGLCNYVLQKGEK